MRVLSPNQVVAYNLRLAREEMGWTQEQSAKELEPHLGTRWSASTFSVAEHSCEPGSRAREFTANDVAAFARAFGRPVMWFHIPPADSQIQIGQLRLEAFQYVEALSSKDLGLFLTDRSVIERLSEIAKRLPAGRRAEFQSIFTQSSWPDLIDALETAAETVKRVYESYQTEMETATREYLEEEAEAAGAVMESEGGGSVSGWRVTELPTVVLEETETESPK